MHFETSPLGELEPGDEVVIGVRPDGSGIILRRLLLHSDDPTIEMRTVDVVSNDPTTGLLRLDAAPGATIAEPMELRYPPKAAGANVVIDTGHMAECGECAELYPCRDLRTEFAVDRWAQTIDETGELLGERFKR